MRMDGVTYCDASKNRKKGEVTFWGEWEAQSSFDVISETDKDLDKPRLCHTPFFDSSYSGDMKYGTDPFIFGDHFGLLIVSRLIKASEISMKIQLLFLVLSVNKIMCFWLIQFLS